MISHVFCDIRATQPASEYEGGVSARFNLDKVLQDGTAADKADRVWKDVRSLAGSANEDIDLRSVTDAFGASISFVEIVAIIIEAASANAGNIEVKPSASNGFTGFLKDASDILVLKPGTSLMLFNSADGQYSTTTSNKSLNFNNTAGSTAAYTVTVIGRSA